MADVKDVANYLIYSYELKTGTKFENNELKLQKLIYFAQRESLALTGEVLFLTELKDGNLVRLYLN